MMPMHVHALSVVRPGAYRYRAATFLRRPWEKPALARPVVSTLVSSGFGAAGCPALHRDRHGLICDNWSTGGAVKMVN